MYEKILSSLLFFILLFSNVSPVYAGFSGSAGGSHSCPPAGSARSASVSASASAQVSGWLCSTDAKVCSGSSCTSDEDFGLTSASSSVTKSANVPEGISSYSWSASSSAVSHTAPSFGDFTMPDNTTGSDGFSQSGVCSHICFDNIGPKCSNESTN